MNITGTHITYYHVCHRKLWLFHHQVQMEQTSERVEEGKWVGGTTYDRRSGQYKELALDGIKIDHLDTQEKLVREVKLTDKVEEAHIWQVKYYLYVLENNQMPGYAGLIEYPKMKQTQPVELETTDREQIEAIKEVINKLVNGPCPEVINMPICKRCSYYDLCYVD